MDGFKLEGGGLNCLKRFSQTFKPRMKLLRETNDKKFSLQKHKGKTTAPEKQSVVSGLQILKLNLKRLRIKRMHTDVYTGSL